MQILPSPAAAGPEATVRSGADQRRIYAWYVVVVLSVLYIVAFIDRVILNLLVVPIRAHFDRSDTQISLLQGAAFAIFYGLFGIPLARIADRGNRLWLIAAGVLVWSFATVSSAFAASFAVLVVLRIGLAIGEAALSPAALSMIGDLFPEEKRALPQSIYIAAGLVGSFVAFIIGSGVVQAVGDATSVDLGPLGRLAAWQAIFVLVGVPGLLLVPVMLATMSEPARRSASGKAGEAAPSLRQVIEELRSKPRLYVGLLIGGGLLAIITSSLPAPAGCW